MSKFKTKTKYHLDYFYEKEQKPKVEIPNAVHLEEEIYNLEEAKRQFEEFVNYLKEQNEREHKRFFINFPGYEEICYIFSDRRKAGQTMYAIDALLRFKEQLKYQKKDLVTELIDEGYTFKEVNKIKKNVDILLYNGREYVMLLNFDFLYDTAMEISHFIGTIQDKFLDESNQYFPEYAYTKHIYGY
jgi:hypothetical protein